MKLSVLVTLAFVSLASAKDATSFILKERVAEPTEWIKRGPAPDSHVLRLNFGLKQRGLDQLESKLLDVSTPSSQNYGKFLSQSQVDQYLQPVEQAIPSVRRWLSEHGVEEDLSKRSPSGDWLTASLTVAQARSLLGDAQFNIYEHRSTGEQLVRTTEYSVPRDVSDHLDLVSPTTYFRQIRALNQHNSGAIFEPLEKDFKPLTGLQRVSANQQASTNAQIAAGQPASCNATRVTAQCLRDYYQVSDYKVKSSTNQFVGISGFLDEYANFADLQNYLVNQRPDAAKANYKFDVVKLAGSNNSQADPGVEANLDVQTVAGIGFPIPSTYYSVAGSPPFKPDELTPTNTNEPYSTEFEYLIRQPDDKLPSVLSTSYGDDEQTVPLAYQRRVCYEAAVLGLRGTTLLISSGDSGVGPDGKCVSNDGKNTRKFLPAFPASCPYITTVGGTQNFAPERTVGPSFYGGGGFSETWPQPIWQREAVDAYVASLNGEYDGLYNKKGRAYPDLSAQSLDFVISINGSFGRVSGTSASTPLTAGIIALLNDQRLAAGKSKLGFLAPALYLGAGAKGLNDITEGSNNGCDTSGFPAKQGWDAATGWGTPRFKQLSAVLG
jgi:tripeptidyl-peptidase I